MAISLPAPEAARTLERDAGEQGHGPSLVAQAGQLLKRCGERVMSAVFDGDGDCMRF